MLEYFETQAKERQRDHGGTAPGKPKTVSQKIDSVIDKNQNKAAQKVAEMAGTNRQYVSDAKRIKAEAPELLEQIRDGQKTITQAKH